jgi:predicted ferric reductase
VSTRVPDPGLNPDEMETTVSGLMLGVLLIGALIGGTVIALLPIWLPSMSNSLTSDQPTAYWFLTRSSALVAYTLLWLSMASGVMITNKLARLWPGGPTAFAFHEHTSLLGLAFGVFHALVLLADHYIGFTLFQVLVPFASSGYRPIWVALGQIGIYGLAVVTLSFYVRKQMGVRTWRVIHYVSYAVFALALAHGVLSGTDSTTGWAQLFYWFTASSLVFLTIYRLVVVRPKAARPAPAARPGPVGRMTK